jgi:hypothetical protein
MQARTPHNDNPNLPVRYGADAPAIPGSEFPRAVYASIGAAFVWMFAAAWLAFGTNTGTDLDLVIIGVLFAVFLGIPIILAHVARSWWRMPESPRKPFLSSQVDTATGDMPASQAWLEVLIIPGALALAATLIGAVYVLGS